MRSILFVALASALFVSSFTLAMSPGHAPLPPEFSAIAEENPHPFLPIAGVLKHPRCMNCHVSGESPRQGDLSKIHSPPVKRGPDGRGQGMKCTSCHREKNGPVIPGAPDWHLAPLSMAWEGLNESDLCRTLTDQTKNGGRSPEALADHMLNDALVGWAWNPGGKRTPVPVSKEEFGVLLQSWIAAGAPCP